MKIFIAANSPSNDAPYLEEILRVFCPPCIERAPLEEALQRAKPQDDVLLLPADCETSGVEEFLHRGGNVVALRPRDEVLRWANLKNIGERKTPSRLRVAADLCAPLRGDSLWMPSGFSIYESDLPIEESCASTLAYGYEPYEYPSESAAIFERAVGEGTLTVFAFDAALCITRLRQGQPERAGLMPPHDQITRATYLHSPGAPHDIFWKPTADLHALLLCDVICDLLSRHAPVPTLWHLPFGKHSVVLWSGDEDGAEQKDNQQEFADLEAESTAMTMYVIPGSTSITQELVDEYSARGHEISVHPDISPAAGKPVAEQIQKAETDVLAMRERFGVPCETVRTHRGMWPGYLDLPELWERLNIGMDGSCLTSLLFQSNEVGPYVNGNAALPLRFSREDGTLINVLQQHAHISDDLWFHPTINYSQKYLKGAGERVARRMLEDAALIYHVPHSPILHPQNYVTFSNAAGKEYLKVARENDLPVWPLNKWNNFWRARETWRLDEYSWQDGRLEITLSGAYCEGLCLSLPAVCSGSALKNLRVDDEPVIVKIARRYQREVVMVELQNSPARIVAHYQKEN